MHSKHRHPHGMTRTAPPTRPDHYPPQGIRRTAPTARAEHSHPHQNRRATRAARSKHRHPHGNRATTPAAQPECRMSGGDQRTASIARRLPWHGDRPFVPDLAAWVVAGGRVERPLPHGARPTVPSGRSRGGPVGWFCRGGCWIPHRGWPSGSSGGSLGVVGAPGCGRWGRRFRGGGWDGRGRRPSRQVKRSGGRRGCRPRCPNRRRGRGGSRGASAPDFPGRPLVRGSAAVRRGTGSAVPDHLP